jgi:hypothetical protein
VRGIESERFTQAAPRDGDDVASIKLEDEVKKLKTKTKGSALVRAQCYNV